MHAHLRAAAARHAVTVDVRAGVAERIPLPDERPASVFSELAVTSP